MNQIPQIISPYLSTGAFLIKTSQFLSATASRVAAIALIVFSSKIFWAIAICFVAIFTVALLTDESMNIPNNANSTGGNQEVIGGAPSPTNGHSPGLLSRIAHTFNSTEPGDHDDEKYPFITAILPLPPARITQGCQNLGLTCWFNSSLNLLAGTTHFDAILNMDFSLVTNSEAKTRLMELVPFLKIAVNELRSERPLETDLALTLREKIGMVHYMGTTNDGSASNANVQHDAAEFLTNFLGDWDSIAKANPGLVPEAPMPTIRSVYKPIGPEPMSRAPTNASREGLVNVAISKAIKNDPKEPINLDQALKTRSVDIFQPDNSPDDTRRNYTKKDYIVTESSNTLIINITRVFPGGVRLGNPVHINYDGTVTVPGPDNQKQRYAVKAALIQGGGANSGHWYYVEANVDGKFYEHNDSNVYEIPKGDCESLREAGIRKLRTGTIFFLEKVTSPTV